jgi:hypothetical protein
LSFYKISTLPRSKARGARFLFFERWRWVNILAPLLVDNRRTGFSRQESAFDPFTGAR